MQEQIDVSKVGCYVYQNGLLAEVLVISEENHSVVIKDVSEGDVI